MSLGAANVGFRDDAARIRRCLPWAEQTSVIALEERR
jgi:hypothetical protein